MYQLAVIALLASAVHAINPCPSDQLTFPCKCCYPDDVFDYPSMCCFGFYNDPTRKVTNQDIKQVFDNLDKNLTGSERHFGKLWIMNTEIKVLSDVFHDITFDYIEVSNNNNLTKIDDDAFKHNYKITKRLTIKVNDKFIDPVENVFKLVNRFVHLEDLFLDNINIIPDKVFGELDKLSSVSFWGQQVKLCNKVFSKLKNLTYISFTDFSIYSGPMKLPDYAFEFDNSLNNTLSIHLMPNMEGPSGQAQDFLSAKTLLKSNRNITLVIDIADRLEPILLNQTIFEPFLNENLYNLIKLNQFGLDCQDCANLWLKQQYDKYLKIRDDLRNYSWGSKIEIIAEDECAYGGKVLDKENFKKCQV